jgi:hypothetical protein
MADPIQSWITLAEVKDALDLGSDTSHDAKLSPIIDGVCRAIEDYCCRTFLAQTETAQKLDGDGTDTLLLRPPVISIASITNDTTAVVSTSYALYLPTGKVLLTDGSAWTNGPQKITITYRHGWEREKIPASLKSAALFWVIKRWHELKDDRIGVSSKTFGDQSTTYYQTMPQETREMIDPYRMLVSI